MTQQVLPIYVSSQSVVAANHSNIPLVEENAGEALITVEGNYRLIANVWYNSGDYQKNESFFIVIKDRGGDNVLPQDANAGIYKVVPDDPGAPHLRLRDAGLFYLQPGIITIELHHYYTIANMYPEFIVDGPIDRTESVEVVSFKLEYYQP